MSSLISVGRAGLRAFRLRPATPLWLRPCALKFRLYSSAGKDDPELQLLSKVHFGKPYEELGTHEQQHVAGKKGELHRRAQQEYREGEEYPQIAEHVEKHLYGTEGGASTKAEGGGPDVPLAKLRDIAKEKYAASWEDITAEQRMDVGRTAAIRESQDSGADASH